jgi:hypothetical protein
METEEAKVESMVVARTSVIGTMKADAKVNENKKLLIKREKGYNKKALKILFHKNNTLQGQLKKKIWC